MAAASSDFHVAAASEPGATPMEVEAGLPGIEVKDEPDSQVITPEQAASPSTDAAYRSDHPEAMDESAGDADYRTKSTSRSRSKSANKMPSPAAPPIRLGSPMWTSGATPRSRNG